MREQAADGWSVEQRRLLSVRGWRRARLQRCHLGCIDWSAADNQYRKASNTPASQPASQRSSRACQAIGPAQQRSNVDLAVTVCAGLCGACVWLAADPSLQ